MPQHEYEDNLVSRSYIWDTNLHNFSSFPRCFVHRVVYFRRGRAVVPTNASPSDHPLNPFIGQSVCLNTTKRRPIDYKLLTMIIILFMFELHANYTVENIT
jgi:hypothetical protein